MAHGGYEDVRPSLGEEAVATTCFLIFLMAGLIILGVVARHMWRRLH